MSRNSLNRARPGSQLRLVRGLAPPDLAPCVLTNGAFDGLHIGHGALTARALERAV